MRRPIPLEVSSIVDTYTQQHELSAPASSLLREWLEQLNRRVHYGIIVTESAAQSDAAGKLSDGLIDLAKQGIFVFVLQETERPHPEEPKRLVRMTLGGDKRPELLKERIDENGIRLNHISLVAASESDPYFLLLAGLRGKFSSVREELLPPLVTRPAGSPQQGNEIAFLPLEPSLSDALDSRLDVLLNRLLFAERINMSDRAHDIASGAILDSYGNVAVRAKENREQARAIIASVTTADFETVAGFFDPRSGAVYLMPDTWRTLVKNRQANQHIKSLIDYFDARLPDYWQEDRPSMRRVLFAPTKVLLRGEQYYVNMLNASPFKRLKSMWSEATGAWRETAASIQGWHPTTNQEWQLLLGFHDQIRNIALQLYLFVHAGAKKLGKFEGDFEGLWGNGNTGTHGLLSHAICAYYACLLGRFEEVWISSTELIRIISAIEKPLWALIDKAESYAADQRQDKEPSFASSYGSLVRRWREADHPGENLLVAAVAAVAAKDDSAIDVVGIGWGGIELPLIFAYVSKVLHPSSKQQRAFHVAEWSHYRAPQNDVAWYHFPEHKENSLKLIGKRVVLLDDNTLTGVTLEHLRDELLLSGADDVLAYVTRYSGERRHAQMLMDGSGAVDPEVLLKRIGGYLGETPFARSWSRTDYKNPIGVFSLSRRRILECIHNNSTVELYQREGF